MQSYSPETLAARITQIVKTKEEAAVNIEKLRKPVDHATAETALRFALRLVLEQIWRNELDMSERWIFTQAL